MMHLQRILTRGALVLATLACLHEQGRGQEANKPFTNVSAEQLKKICVALKLDHETRKGGGILIRLVKPGEPTTNYTIVAESFNHGQAIVIGVDFFGLQVPAEQTPAANKLLHRINQWNVETVLNRAVGRKLFVQKGKVVVYPRLEADLDCTLGVTANDVERMIQRFPTALRDFEVFVKAESKDKGGK